MRVYEGIYEGMREEAMLWGRSQQTYEGMREEEVMLRP